jgi:hypothetical protein
MLHGVPIPSTMIDLTATPLAGMVVVPTEYQSAAAETAIIALYGDMTMEHSAKFKTSSRLSPEEVSQYRSEGYVLPKGKVFSDEKFAALFEHFETKLAAWPKDQRPEAMDTPHFGDPKLNEWALAPEVVDLVEPLLGPDILLFSTHFICKPTGDGRRVPWHEDSAYWRKLQRQGFKAH